MYTALEATPGQPTAVGVAPGTTTVLLTGPTAASQSVVGCENPARAARQRYLLYPPGKFVQGVQEAATRIKTVLDPYGSIEALRGAGRRTRRRLGIVTAPYGDRSPYPSYELVAATKDYGPTAYCTKRPERGPNYRWQQTSAYEPEDRNHGINGVGSHAKGLLCKLAGLGCPTPPNLGAVPTDMQLSTQYGYTPVVSQWIPFKQGAYSPAPWTPPAGRAAPTDPAYMTPWGKYARSGIAGPVAAVTTNADGTPMDPATAAVEELKMHQDRMYMLGIVSAAAVASTALINVFRYGAERRDARKRYGKTAAEPSPVMSGTRRRRRR